MTLDEIKTNTWYKYTNAPSWYRDREGFIRILSSVNQIYVECIHITKTEYKTISAPAHVLERLVTSFVEVDGTTLEVLYGKR